MKKKTLDTSEAKAEALRSVTDPAIEQQLKLYEEALQHFQQQKYVKAKPLLEKVIIGPSKEFADRARIHLRIVEQRMQPSEATSVPRSPEDHYQHGVAMMNMGRWDDAREHLLNARKLAPKADYVIYAMAALDCLTGEAEVRDGKSESCHSVAAGKSLSRAQRRGLRFSSGRPQIYRIALSRPR